MKYLCSFTDPNKFKQTVENLSTKFEYKTWVYSCQMHYIYVYVTGYAM